MSIVFVYTVNTEHYLLTTTSTPIVKIQYFAIIVHCLLFMFKICWNKISLNLYLISKNSMISEQGSSIVIKDSKECLENIHVIYANYTNNETLTLTLNTSSSILWCICTCACIAGLCTRDNGERRSTAMWIFQPGTWISIHTWRVQSPSSPPTDSMLLL